MQVKYISQLKADVDLLNGLNNLKRKYSFNKFGWQNP